MRICILLFIWAFSLSYSQLANIDFLKSPHNLTGDHKSNDLSVCRACHLSDKSNEFINVNPSQFCLSCHDGSVGNSFNRQSSIQSIHSMDLFYHNYQMNENIPYDLPLRDKMITCITCHDPHDNSKGQFLRLEKSQLCMSCHPDQNLELSAHKHSFSMIKDLDREIECQTCHDIHLISQYNHLLVKEENQLCIGCHDGIKNNDQEIASVDNITITLGKLYTHVGPIVNSSTMGMARVSCSDCHNSHTVSDKPNGFLPGALIGSSGISKFGNSISVSTHEYEICYKCHGFNSNPIFTSNIAAKFNGLNKSSHPIERYSNNLNAKMSLRQNYQKVGFINCSDCHGNDNALGIKGPHGSKYKGILKSNYSQSPFTTVNISEDNSLCFTCHDFTFIVESGGFRWHKIHIENGGYNCVGCHDAHGSQSLPSLLNFNRSFIDQNQNGEKLFTQLGSGSGSCSLTCHGHIHQNQSY